MVRSPFKSAEKQMRSALFLPELFRDIPMLAIKFGTAPTRSYRNAVGWLYCHCGFKIHDIGNAYHAFHEIHFVRSGCLFFDVHVGVDRMVCDPYRDCSLFV